MNDSHGLSYATWQDRQLSEIADRIGKLLGEFREDRGAPGRIEALARDLGRVTALLEIREADLQSWQSKTAEMKKQLERQAEIETHLRTSEQMLQQEVARLSANEKNYAAEDQTLASRMAAATFEAANLRRLVSEIQHSLSWKITAPLRFLSKPLFAALARAKAAPVVAPAAGLAPAAVVPAPNARTLDPIEQILPILRRARSIALIPCAIPFSAALNQRPIACARYLADCGTTVLYVAWQWSPDEAVPQAWEEVYPGVVHIPLYAFLRNIDSIASASHATSVYLCTLPSAALAEIISPLRAAGYHIHYDIMDDWEEFHRGGEASWFAESVEREVVVLSDTVTAISEKLAGKFAHLRSDIAVVRNGYQPSALHCEQFLAARAPLAHPKTIGYFGHLSDAWFDWDTVFHAARKLPQTCFEIIGWGPSDRSRARMDELPNIRYLGLVPQGELHRHVSKWWGGMIPFRPSPVSAAVDPLKIYEYLHFGLSTVVTGISGIAEYPLVHYANDRVGFVSAIENISARPDEKSLSEVAEFLKDCVWEQRFAKLNSLVKEPAGLVSLYTPKQ